MDSNPSTTNLTSHTDLNPPIESGWGALKFSPQLLTCDQESANVSNAEYPSFKKPRTSQTPMTSPTLFNKPNMSIPFKNVTCLQFQRGHCTYGDNCHFAHGVGNTQKLLPQREELMNMEIWKEDQRIIASMRLCRRFCNGEQCPFGVRCHFLHEAPAKFRKGVATSIGPGGLSRNESEEMECKPSGQPSLNFIQLSQKPVFWKTRLCNKWEATGNCPFGIYCYFAHGHAELKMLGSNTTEFGNVSTSNVIPTAVMCSSSSVTGNGTASEKKMQFDKKMQGKMRFLKWKGFEKINQIYADWIDDMPLVHSSLGKAGS